jgi:hypothetical protein
VQRLPDQQLGDERAVRVRRVDEVDAQLDRPPQHPHRAVGVGRVAPHAGAGELHRPEPESHDRQVAAELVRAGSLRDSHEIHPRSTVDPGLADVS